MRTGTGGWSARSQTRLPRLESLRLSRLCGGWLLTRGRTLRKPLQKPLSSSFPSQRREMLLLLLWILVAPLASSAEGALTFYSKLAEYTRIVGDTTRGDWLVSRNEHTVDIPGRACWPLFRTCSGTRLYPFVRRHASVPEGASVLGCTGPRRRCRMASRPPARQLTASGPAQVHARGQLRPPRMFRVPRSLLCAWPAPDRGRPIAQRCPTLRRPCAPFALAPPARVACSFPSGLPTTCTSTDLARPPVRAQRTHHGPGPPARVDPGGPAVVDLSVV